MLTALQRITLGTHCMHLAQTEAPSDRTAIPAINLSESGEAFHFGGALREDEVLPSNYVACTTQSFSLRKNTLVNRMLECYFDNEKVSNSIDFTFMFAGTQYDEVPERAVATCRVVGSALRSCALPIPFVTDDEAVNKKYPSTHTAQRKSPGGYRFGEDFQLLFAILVLDPLRMFASYFSKKLFARRSFGVEKPSGVTPRKEARDKSLNPPRISGSTDPFESALDELIESLDEVTVPVRGEQMSRKNLLTSSPSTFRTQEGPKEDGTMVQVPILRMIETDDIRRYFVAAECSLKGAAVRIVQSAAWRGLTFPIDTRMCRIELQTGQFFQQGRDLQGHPVFYFRNACLGQWRRNEEATIAAVLHRLETTLTELKQEEPRVRCTLIVMMGRPRLLSEGGADEDAGDADPVLQESGSRLTSSEDFSTETVLYPEHSAENNPRVHPEEKWHTHSSKRMILRLIELVMTHYPERLSKALVVVGHGNRTYMRTALQGRLALSSAVLSKRTRERVKFLTKYKDLQDHVDKEILVKLVGGTSAVASSAFDCT